MHLFKCPACGHRYEVPDERLGKKLMCKKCNGVFRAMPEDSLQQALAPLKEEAEKEEASPPARVQKVLQNSSVVQQAVNNWPLAIDGAVPGAISGILAGVVVGIVYGAATGEAVAQALVGFITGFGLGALLGAVAGMSGGLSAGENSSKPVIATALLGAVVGLIVGLIIGDSSCLLWGALAGGVGGIFWRLLCGWVERSASLPTGTSEKQRELVDEHESKKQRRPGRASREDVLNYHPHY
ncbi:MAG TPA: hypothetical protein VG013_08450 [Gemmataceae bacterium]|jgi:hypothetical protein|nr:hypothetical protein [Gemmataceae bacterium]